MAFKEPGNRPVHCVKRIPTGLLARTLSVVVHITSAVARHSWSSTQPGVYGLYRWHNLQYVRVTPVLELDMVLTVCSRRLMRGIPHLCAINGLRTFSSATNLGPTKLPLAGIRVLDMTRVLAGVK